MTHPLIPQLLELAHPVAASLNLEVVNAVFHTHQNPATLRIDIRNLSTDTGLQDCESMSRAFEVVLETAQLIPDAYVLEISSPGLSEFLQSDRDFTSFRGFPVLIKTETPIHGQSEWEGSLVGRDDTVVRITHKGRIISIPRDRVIQVQLQTVTE